MVECSPFNDLAAESDLDEVEDLFRDGSGTAGNTSEVAA